MKTKLIDHYIAKQILMMILVVLLVLSGLDSVFTLISELDNLAPHYHASQAMIFVLASTPSTLYEFIPVATLIGCLLALGNLANNSELIVMRAAGISVFGIIGRVLKPVIGLVIVSLLAGQFLIPLTEHFAQSYRELKLGGGSVFRVKHGNWQRQGDEFIHIDTIAPNGVIHGITRYRFSGEQLQEMSFSKQAQFSGKEWLMENQQRYELNNSRVEIHQWPQAVWRSQLTPEILELVVLKPEHLSITGLYRYADYMQQQGLRYLPYLLAFWKKVSQPLATLVMVLVAASFIFGPLRSVTMGLRMMVGLMAGLCFKYLQEFLSFASIVFNIQPWVASLVPIMIFAVLGFWLLRRVK